MICLKRTNRPEDENRSIDYDAVSSIYDQVRVGDAEMVSQLISGMKLTKGTLVLDVGCGTANNTLLFSFATGSKMVGLDLSRGMLNVSGAKTSRIEFVQSPAENLPFNNEMFEYIFMTEVIHHLEDVESTLSEIYRILKQGGRFCVTTQSHDQIAQRATSQPFPSTIAIDQSRSTVQESV